MALPVPPDRCPLCREENECAVVQGRRQCWCFGVTVPRELVERLQREMPGSGCVCPQCATGKPSPTQLARRLQTMKRWRGAGN